jgi:hypothetical protein
MAPKIRPGTEDSTAEKNVAISQPPELAFRQWGSLMEINSRVVNTTTGRPKNPQRP